MSDGEGNACMADHEMNFDPFEDFYLKESALPDDPDGRVDLRDLTQFQRTLLVTEGTLEKFLEAWMLEPIMIRHVSQEETGTDREIPLLGLPAGEKIIKRQVLLTGKYSGTPFVFAKSLYALERLEQILRTDLSRSDMGLGKIIREHRIETFFQMVLFGKKKAGLIGPYFHIDKNEMLLFRRFRIYIKQEPAALITEKFPITLAV
jgi:chorismate-pyruvate lyase